jgi:ubiquinone/menaquinone biosynthesis C-methylase UbiE
MKTDHHIRKAIRERWSRPECVAGWTGSGLNADFHDASARRAWRTALKQAVRDSVGAALDIGTGPGTIAQLWAELGYRTTGIDVSPGMLETARTAAATAGLSISFLQGDAETPPFTRQRFAVISSRFVLFTLPHPGYAVRRWVELLRPGGAIVLIGHSRAQPSLAHPALAHAQAQAPLRRGPQRPPDVKHQETLQQLPFVNHTVNDLQVLLEAVGLRNIRRIAMDAVIAARSPMIADGQVTGAHSSPPFIIVGHK